MKFATALALAIAVMLFTGCDVSETKRDSDWESCRDNKVQPHCGGYTDVYTVIHGGD
jgi:hypothetical protein